VVQADETREKIMKTAGRSSLIPFLFYPKFVYGAPGGSRSWAWRTTGGAGRATPQNIKRYVEGYNKHLEPGGVNEHLGRRDAIYGGSVVNQRTGETVADWEDKGIIQFYKNKPMFEVVGRELLKVAKSLMAERDFPPEWDKAYGIGEQLAGQFEWSIDDAILAAMTIAEGRENALREKFRASLGDNLEKDVDFIVTEARRAAKRVSSLVKSRDQARLAILGLLAGLLETPNLHDLAALVYDEAEKEQEKAPARVLVDENTPELKAWIGMLQKITDDYHQKNYEHVKPPKFELSVGPRYIRVVSDDGVQHSAHSFIRRDNGDILKAAGWAAPAKHARGNIFAPDGGKSALTGHGSVRYLASQMVKIAKELVAFEWGNEIEGPHIRFHWGGHAGAHGLFELEEMPERGKKTLRILSGGLAPWISSGGPEMSTFNIENLVHYAGVHRNLTYEQAKEAITSAAQKLVDEVNKRAMAAGKKAYEYQTLFSGPYENTVHYLKVEPPDTKPFIAEGSDFKISVKWTKFETYSPGSDFQQSDPHYTLLVSSAPASARKLYKILKADPGALKSVSWMGLSDWLRKNGIGYETRFSVWH
jgi:hypothetical protein